MKAPPNPSRPGGERNCQSLRTVSMRALAQAPLRIHSYSDSPDSRECECWHAGEQSDDRGTGGSPLDEFNRGACRSVVGRRASARLHRREFSMPRAGCPPGDVLVDAGPVETERQREEQLFER